jgi:hypothetical protein
MNATQYREDALKTLISQNDLLKLKGLPHMNGAELSDAADYQLHVATTYFEEYGELVSDLEMNWWYEACHREAVIEFQINDLEIHWVNKHIEKMNDRFEFEGVEPHFDGLNRVLYYLQNNSPDVYMQDAKMDAYACLYDNCEKFKAYCDTL